MITQREKDNRKSLEQRKPKVFEKIKHFPERIARGESIALIQLQYNYSCNFKCKHCAIEKFKDNGKESLSVKEVMSIADQADKMGLASICVSGGEPLIFPDLSEVIEAIGRDRFVISIDTNGYFLDEHKIKWLVEQGVDRVHLSIDGLEGNHSIFRHNDKSWDRCIEALKHCRENGLGVVINIVPTKSLLRSGELIKELEFLKDFGEHASLIFPKPVGAFIENDEEILDTNDIEYLNSLSLKYNVSTHLTPNHGYFFGCLCFKRHFSITAYGDVLACPWIPITFGNIRNENLADIVKRGLSNMWFSYDNKFSCLSGNKDSYFYQNIIPQIYKSDIYPADWRKIKW